MTRNMQNTPLANRLRPKSLSDFFGQAKITGEGSFLRQAIREDRIPSIIFWGPPGTGKTTLASIIADKTDSDFVQLSAVTSGVKDLRQVVKEARQNREKRIKTILFIDEIHRWNKAQQDALLPHIEDGTVILIGATTENPSFSINSPLLSRAKVITLEALSREDLQNIVTRALKKEQAKADKEAIDLMARLANGDARIALNIVELCLQQSKNIDKDLVKRVLDRPELIYDRAGEEHYNVISAFIKSMRGSDPDATLYWLARMLQAGEDPLFIARRMIIFAGEDIGIANNSALLLANAVFDACHKIGMPEARINLSHAAVYLAKSPKNNSTYEAYNRAEKDVREYGNLAVPFHLRNAPTGLMKELGYGEGYKYPHHEDDREQGYLPQELRGKKYL
ncbi:MAG: replication-associated recombination protein A [Patescibacteria group bacterium]